MEALILSCSTGGGHNSAARAVQDAFLRHGGQAVLLDPYSLQSDRTARMVANAYVRLVQHFPNLFGIVYQIGKAYAKVRISLPLHHHSPVYYAQKKMAPLLWDYMQKLGPDVIVTTHVFCAEMLTLLREEGKKLPPVLYIATDYTCIPFTEEAQADYFIIGDDQIKSSFEKMGIDKARLLGYGIPVRAEFEQPVSKEEAKERLHLDAGRKYIVLSGGSIGCGHIDRTIGILQQFRKEHPEVDVLVMTGSNRLLKKQLEEKGLEHFHVYPVVDRMDLFLQASEIFIGKPGGLSTTEAVQSRIPLVLVSPIPGCETQNARFFDGNGMARWAKNEEEDLLPILEEIWKDPSGMQKAQKELKPGAADRLVTLAEACIVHDQREARL